MIYAGNQKMNACIFTSFSWDKRYHIFIPRGIWRFELWDLADFG